MGKLIFWLAVLGAVYLAARAVRLIDRRDESRREQRDAPREMARCAHCGVYFPADEGVRLDGRDYCSPEHRDAGA